MKLHSDLGKSQEITDVETWLKLCPPAEKKHWKDNRSAKEMAKFWVSQKKQKEFSDFLSQSKHKIELECGIPEMAMKFDDYKSPRKTDLAIFGEIDSVSTLISIEGKADEPYGSNYFTKEFMESVKKKSIDNNSMKLNRCIELFKRYNHDSKFLNIRYQLLYWLAGSVDMVSVNKTKNKINSIYLISQEFHSSETKEKNIFANKNDFDNFISLISKNTFNSEKDNFIVGPYNNEFTKNIDVYFGKYVTKL